MTPLLYFAIAAALWIGVLVTLCITTDDLEDFVGIGTLSFLLSLMWPVTLGMLVVVGFVRTLYHLNIAVRKRLEE